MTYRKVGAGRGVEWLKDSVQLLLKNPAPFALMGLLMAVIMAVPVLGGLALLVLGPALYAGFMVAARNQQASAPVEFTQLFAAFQQEGKLPKMLALCLPAVAAMIILGILAAVVIGGAMLGGGLSAASGSDAFAMAALGGGGIVFVLIALAVGFVAHALVFFAIPRVMFDDIEPFAAMKESFAAVIANIGAVLVYMVLLLLAYIVLGIVIGSWSQLLMQIVAGVVVLPVVAVAVYYAYRDVFAGTDAAITGESAAVAAPYPQSPPPPAPGPSDPTPPPAV